MTTLLRLPKGSTFEQKVAYYRALSKISPWVTGGREIRAMGRRWLKENGVSHRSSPLSHSIRKDNSDK